MIRLLISLFLLFICTDLKSQSENREPKSFKAFPIKSEDIKLDGKLDDTFWSDVAGISDFFSSGACRRWRANRKNNC